MCSLSKEVWLTLFGDTWSCRCWRVLRFVHIDTCIHTRSLWLNCSLWLRVNATTKPYWTDHRRIVYDLHVAFAWKYFDFGALWSRMSLRLLKLFHACLIAIFNPLRPNSWLKCIGLIEKLHIVNLGRFNGASLLHLFILLLILLPSESSVSLCRTVIETFFNIFAIFHINSCRWLNLLFQVHRNNSTAVLLLALLLKSPKAHSIFNEVFPHFIDLLVNFYFERL